MSTARLSRVAAVGALALLLLTGALYAADALASPAGVPSALPSLAALPIPGLAARIQPVVAAATTPACTFEAGDSRYYRGSAADPSQLIGSGPIRFSWNPSTGKVFGAGGYWREFLAATQAWVTYGNIVNSGSVTSAGAVRLMFMGTPLAQGQRPYLFAMTGRLSSVAGTSRLSAQADGANLFVASGTVICPGASTAPTPKPKAAARPRSRTRTTRTVIRITTKVIQITQATSTPSCSDDDRTDGGDESESGGYGSSSPSCPSDDDSGDGGGDD